jgi:hypothetical protein
MQDAVYGLRRILLPRTWVNSVEEHRGLGTKALNLTRAIEACSFVVNLSLSKPNPRQLLLRFIGN